MLIAAKGFSLPSGAAVFVNPELEARVLANLARDEEAFWRFSEDYLSESVFALPENRAYFRALADAYSRREGIFPEPPAPVAGADLFPAGELEAAVARLCDLAQRRVAAEVVARFWERLVSGGAVRDTLVEAIEELGRAQEVVKLLAPGEGVPVSDLLARAEKEYAEARKLMQETGRPSPHPSFGPDLKALTRLFGGLQPGLWFIGGRPGAGKTFLVFNMAVRYLEAERDTGLLWADVGEVTPAKWGVQFACVVAGECYRRFERYLASGQEFSRVVQAASRIARRAMYYRVDASTLVAHLRGAVRRLKAKTGAARVMVVVDYIQKWAELVGGSTDARQRVNSLLVQISTLCDVANGPVVVISSLRKEGWSGGAELEDFAESGMIGHLAEVAVILSLTDDKRNKDTACAVKEVVFKVVKKQTRPRR